MDPHYEFIAETVVDCLLTVKHHARYDEYTIDQREKVSEGIGLVGMMLWQKLYNIDGGVSQEDFVSTLQRKVMEGLLPWAERRY